MTQKRSVGFELRTLGILIKRKIEKSAEKEAIDKMTGTHGWAIAFFGRHQDRDLFQRDFEEEFSIRRSTATKILQLMEKNELIRRESVSYDARLKRIILTPKALDIHTLIKSKVAAFETIITTGITEDELEVFFKVIEKIKRNVE